MYFGQFSVIYLPPCFELCSLVLTSRKPPFTCFWAKNWGSQTIRPRQICLWRFGLSICGWGLGFGVLGFWAWDEFWEHIVTDSKLGKNFLCVPTTNEIPFYCHNGCGLLRNLKCGRNCNTFLH